jgi:hypothetical protein
MGKDAHRYKDEWSPSAKAQDKLATEASLKF